MPLDCGLLRRSSGRDVRNLKWFRLKRVCTVFVSESCLSLRDKENNALLADFSKSQILHLEVSDIKLVRIVMVDESTSFTGNNDNFAIEFYQKKSVHSFLMDLKLNEYSVIKSPIKVAHLLSKRSKNEKEKNSSSICNYDDGSVPLSLENANTRSLLINLLFDPSFPMFVTHVQSLLDNMHTMVMSAATDDNINDTTGNKILSKNK